MKKIAIVLFLTILGVLFFEFNMQIYAEEDIIGSYNMIGIENYDYELRLEAVKRSQTFALDEEKISFYMLGGDLVNQSNGYYEFIERDSDLGFKIVFISPEAGRLTGDDYQTKNFYPDLNSILRIINADSLIYRFVEESWQVEIVDDDNDLLLYYEEKDGTRTLLESANDPEYSDEQYIISLDNYTLHKEFSHFEMDHVFSVNSPLNIAFGYSKITFKSEEIMFRTYETRLSKANESDHIEVTRRPSDTLIGTVLRFGSDSDEGDNLAIVQSVDEANNKIYIKYVNVLSYNTHDEGTWLRAFNDYTNGTVYANEYPKVYLEPTFWAVEESALQSLMDFITEKDPSGMLSDVTVELEDEDAFGYKLQDVTYSRDGLNFTGGFSGAFYVGFEWNIFGWSVDVGPVRLDYGSAMSALADQILRINTYKVEAFRFYFNPNIFESYADWKMISFNPPSVFPLTFRLYFDKEFELIGGNVRFNLPGSGIPLPGGLIYIDNIGGGFMCPETYEVGARFQSYEGGYGFPLWNADVDMRLALDQDYLYLTGRSWFFNKTISIGNFDALVSWSYTEGKQFKGVEIHGQTGIGAYKVNAIIDLTFKFKKYKSDGETNTYIGGSGSASVEVFGYTFAGVKISANTSRFRGSVKVPVIGTKSFSIYYEDVLENITSLAYMETAYGGVARLINEQGNMIVLIPEARKLIQPTNIISLSTNTQATILQLDDFISEAAITIDYTGELDTVTVEMPDGSILPVEIASESTVPVEGKLYAMDYEIADGVRQLYIQLLDADLGDYQVEYGNTVVQDVSIYEITQLPEIDNSEIISNVVDDELTLSWNLTNEIPETEYHLTLVSLDDQDNIIERYPIYEDVVIDSTDEIEERYVDSRALLIDGTSYELKLKMPENLPLGRYAVILEGVLVDSENENLYGEAVISQAFTYSGVSLLATPDNLQIEYIGNGQNNISWSDDSEVSYWSILAMDASGNLVDSFTVTREEILNGGLIDDSSGSDLVSLVTSIGNSDQTPYVFTALAYDTTYYFTVVAHQENTIILSDPYDSILNIIDIGMVIAGQNEGTVTYSAFSDIISAQYDSPNHFDTVLEIYEDPEEVPVSEHELNQTPESNLDYEYDMEENTDTEFLRQSYSETLVFNTSVFGLISLVPNQEIIGFGLTVLRSDGSTLIDIPTLELSLITDSANWFTLLATLNSGIYDFTPEEIDLILDIYSSGAISVGDDLRLNIDFNLLETSCIIDTIADDRYYLMLDFVNASQDETIYNFEIILSRFVPSLFLDSLLEEDGLINITGLVNGAASLTINEVEASIINGYFEVSVELDDGIIDYEIVDILGNIYSGTITIDDDLFAPTIELSSYEDITIYVGENYELPTCSVTDNVDSNLVCQISGTPDNIYITGEYTVVFKAIDYAGNSSEEVSILLTILMQDNPTPSPVNPLTQVLTYISITIGVIATGAGTFLLWKKFRILH